MPRLGRTGRRSGQSRATVARSRVKRDGSSAPSTQDQRANQLARFVRPGSRRALRRNAPDPRSAGDGPGSSRNARQSRPQQAAVPLQARVRFGSVFIRWRAATSGSARPPRSRDDRRRKIELPALSSAIRQPSTAARSCACSWRSRASQAPGQINVLHPPAVQYFLEFRHAASLNQYLDEHWTASRASQRMKPWSDRRPCPRPIPADLLSDGTQPGGSQPLATMFLSI